MIEKRQNYENSDTGEATDVFSWEEEMADMSGKFDEEEAEKIRQMALDGINRIEKSRQNEEYLKQERDIYEARKEHGDDPDYTHIYWVRDGELAVEMGGSREELPVAAAIEKYKDNPFFQAEYAFLTRLEGEVEDKDQPLVNEVSLGDPGEEKL